MPTTAVTNQLLTAGRALGLESKDFAALFEVLATMSGVSASSSGPPSGAADGEGS